MNKICLSFNLGAELGHLTSISKVAEFLLKSETTLQHCVFVNVSERAVLLPRHKIDVKEDITL